MENPKNPLALTIIASIVASSLFTGVYFAQNIPAKIAAYDAIREECNKAFPGSELELQQYDLPADMKIRCWVGIDPVTAKKQKKWKKKQGKSKEDVLF